MRVTTDTPRDSWSNLFSKPTEVQAEQRQRSHDAERMDDEEPALREGKYTYTWPVVREPSRELFDVLGSKQVLKGSDFELGKLPMYSVSLSHLVLDTAAYMRDSILSDDEDSTMYKIAMTVTITICASLLHVVSNVIEVYMRAVVFVVTAPTALIGVAVLTTDMLKGTGLDEFLAYYGALSAACLGGAILGTIQVFTPALHTYEMLTTMGKMRSSGEIGNDATFGLTEGLFTCIDSTLKMLDQAMGSE